MGRALTLLLLLLAAAPARAGVLVVWAPDVPSDQRAKVAAHLAEGGVEVTRAEEAAHLLQRVRLVSVVDRALDEDCGGAVAVDAWRRDLAAAEARLLRLDLRGALSSLSLLELQAACLRTPVTAVDLYTLELDLATVHHLLTRQGSLAPGERAFSERERDAAVRRAAAVGVGLAPPASLNVDLRARLAGVRAGLDAEPSAELRLVGPGAGFGSRLNGRPAAAGATQLAGAPALVQVAPGGEVEAAALLELEPGSRTVVWLDPGGRAWGAVELETALEELGPEPPDAELQALLVAVGALGGGSPDPATGVTTVWVGWEKGDAWAWAATEEGLSLLPRRGRDGPEAERLEPVRPARSVDLDRAPAPARSPAGASLALSAGAGVSTGWSDLRGGPLDGLGGAVVGGGAWVRVGGGRWAGVGALGFAGTPSRRALEDGGGLLFRATLPLALGLRWAPGGLDGGELGPELGWQWFGPYEGRQRGSPTVGLSSGWAGPLGPGLGWRADLGLRLGHTVAEQGGGWYWAPGLRVGLEARP